MARRKKTPKMTKDASKLIAATVAVATADHVAKRKGIETLIKRRVESINESFYDIGVALLEMQEHEYFRAADQESGVKFRSFNAWLAAGGLVNRSFAYELMAIVKGMDRETALAAGPTKAYALVQLKRSTPVADTARGLLERGRVGGKSARKASAREIEQAAKAERAKHPTKAARQRAKEDAETKKRALAIARSGTTKRVRIEIRGSEVHVVHARKAIDEA